MRVEEHDSEHERQILIGMIVDDEVVGKLSQNWVKDPLRSKWSNLIANWCVKHYAKYNKAPGKDIQLLYNAWSERPGKDEDTIRLVGKFLESLSGSYRRLRKGINAPLVLDWATDHFNEVRTSKLKDDLSNMLAVGDVAKAIEKIKAFSDIDVSSTEIVDIFGDKKNVLAAFKENRKSLFTYEGDLGDFISKSMKRDCFVSLMGPEKRGKSYYLMEFAITAALQKRKVLYLDCGDMSKNQVIRRMMTRVAEKPVEKGVVLWPKRIFRDVDDEFATVSFRRRTFNKVLDAKFAIKGCKRLLNEHNIDSDNLKLSCHPNNTLTLGGIKKILKDLERQGWIADMVVIDYADILAMPSHLKEYRQQIDYNWKGMRTLSQEQHALVLTASQTKASSYDAKVLDMTHFADDKRKFAHVTAAIGINQTTAEKVNDIVRLNYMSLREFKFDVNECVHIAGCRALGNLCVLSTY